MRKLAALIYGRARERLGVLFDLSLELVCIFSLLGLIVTVLLFDARLGLPLPSLGVSSSGAAPADFGIPLQREYRKVRP